MPAMDADLRDRQVRLRAFEFLAEQTALHGDVLPWGILTKGCIATDAAGIAIQPEPRPDGKCQACHRGHSFVHIADREHVFFEYARKETSATLLEMSSAGACDAARRVKSRSVMFVETPTAPSPCHAPAAKVARMLALAHHLQSAIDRASWSTGPRQRRGHSRGEARA